MALGRLDMALMLFARAIPVGEPIKRLTTARCSGINYIDDIVEGVLLL